VNNSQKFALSNLVTLQRNLPHWTADKAIYWVTFRLADSIPKDKLDAWRSYYNVWLKNHSQPWDTMTWEEYNEKFGEPFEKWLDAGMGSCALARENARENVRQSLLYFDKIRLILHAAVIMPTHVHCLMEPLEGFELSELLKSIKSYSAHEVNKRLGRTGAFWQKESYDHIVRSEAQYVKYIQYIRENPIKANLQEGMYWLYVEQSM